MITERIHPTAIISKEAEIAADVVMGPFAVIEGKVRIGNGCVLGPFSHLCGPMTLGSRNQVSTGVVLGERPQHILYKDEPTGLEIGDDNVIGAQVTVHRGTTHSGTTRIGNRNVLMANSHVAHDCQVADSCTLAPNALLGGHCILEDNVSLGGNAAVHQFVRLGRLSVLGNASVMTKDLPPFALSQGFNTVCGVNVAGLQEVGHTPAEIDAAVRAFDILYGSNNTLTVALEIIENELAGMAIIQELIQFIRNAKRGIALSNRYDSMPQ
jgi:UDP-N-acetylglucosamine acyltransferase